VNAVTLNDKYEATSGRVYVSGIQALVRLPIEQARRDAAAGLNTAGFISGYRGSPLGGYDLALWNAERHLKANRIRFEPGINEDLAATAVWGTQQVPFFKPQAYDGVFSIWYGKGPGVDRSADVLKHGSYNGSSAYGGVLALCGDDHAARSSSMAHQSEHALIHCGMPILNPVDIQDYVDLGLMGFAMSRYAGVWVGFICITDTVDGSASIMVGDGRIAPVLPADYQLPPGGLSIRSEVAPLGQEARLFEERHHAAQAFVRANGLDKLVVGKPGRRRLGIVTTGKALRDVSEALARLGVGPAEAERLGIGVFKVAMSWPIEPERIRAYAAECDELLVIEEKRGVVEDQLAHLLYNLPADQRPRLTGKTDESGKPLVSAVGELDTERVAIAIAARYDVLAGESTLTPIAARLADNGLAQELGTPVASRLPAYCAGCPHNTSTVVPEGSLSSAGIGCHGMSAFMPSRAGLNGTQMGGEGAQWIGLAPFVPTPHLFQNLGDGTYFHSGLLALRACVAANVNITYKILLNGAVGMTGGQPIEGEHWEGEITSPRVAQQVASEGVKRIALISADPVSFERTRDAFPPGTTFHHRDELDRVQKELREFKGVSVLIYDQSCATERRRLRKRGKVAPATERVLIASEVCEGCGDCGLQSNCIAIEPLDTPLGRKRRINQSVCNQDYSCLKGFCPSFVTISGAKPRSRADSTAGEDLHAGLSEPTAPSIGAGKSLLITGIGGGGVVTVGAILGMASHIEGTRTTVHDMSGLAQRNGSVMSHVRFMPGDIISRATRIPTGSADVVIGCDPIVTAGPDCLRMLKPSGTVVLNRFVAPTSTFAIKPDSEVDFSLLERRVARRIGEDRAAVVDATTIATAILGDAVGANMILVGYAWQLGLIPLKRVSIEAAIQLNGIAVAMNLRAFGLGRLAAASPERLTALMGRGGPVTQTLEPATLEAVVELRSRHLTAYQNEALARRYRALIDRVARTEREIGRDGLALVVARTYAQLLAYKDEYEVARLLTSETFRRELDDAFEGQMKIAFHLAPPLLSRRDPETGRLKKRRFGGWLLGPLRVLAKLKVLRGTPLDLIGYHPHRRKERALIAEYEQLIEYILARLAPENLAVAIELAGIHGTIRGYDIVKDAAIAAAHGRIAACKQKFEEQSVGIDQHVRRAG
jgi:indolepyruvate ferredoxin oxidoreductase